MSDSNRELELAEALADKLEQIATRTNELIVKLERANEVATACLDKVERAEETLQRNNSFLD